jgi:phosphoglycolate phosphatase
MPKQFKLLIFDWDGTLMDSAGAIVESIQAACRDLAIDEPSDEQARYIIGLGLHEALTTLLPDLQEADYPKLVDRYRFHFLARDHELPLFPGVREGIAALVDAGFMLAVATGKSRRGLDRAFEHSGLRSFFLDSRCADESFSKPHPAMVEELMEAFGATPQQTLVIGDTTHDLQMATNAGVASLAVSYGAHPKDNLLALSPLACANNFVEASQWLLARA